MAGAGARLEPSGLMGLDGQAEPDSGSRPGPRGTPLHAHLKP